MEYPSLLVTQVTEHEAVDEDPAWSSDGDRSPVLLGTLELD
jgi:hypothetical protein